MRMAKTGKTPKAAWGRYGWDAGVAAGSVGIRCVLLQDQEPIKEKINSVNNGGGLQRRKPVHPNTCKAKQVPTLHWKGKPRASLRWAVWFSPRRSLVFTDSGAGTRAARAAARKRSDPGCWAEQHVRPKHRICAQPGVTFAPLMRDAPVFERYLELLQL